MLGPSAAPCFIRSMNQRMNHDQFVAAVENQMAEIRSLLISKNRRYGNSALEPIRIFSRAHPTEQLRVRIDDKLSRLYRGIEADEDVIADLIGYLVMLRIAEGNNPVDPLRVIDTRGEVNTATKPKGPTSVKTIEPLAHPNRRREAVTARNGW